MNTRQNVFAALDNALESGCFFDNIRYDIDGTANGLTILIGSLASSEVSEVRKYVVEWVNIALDAAGFTPSDFVV